jgi:signal transduction histidine kinase
VGLTLQNMAARASGDMAKGLGAAVTEIDRVIHQVRSTIYELSMNGESRGIRDNVITLVRELEAVVGFEVRVSFEGPVDVSISDQVAEHLLATVRESVTNIGRHANATEASVHLLVEGDRCRLTISDNGVGIGSSDLGGGLGLTNLRRRAEKLNGTFTIGVAENGGASLVWQVPVRP